MIDPVLDSELNEEREKAEKKAFPRLVCENCGHHNQLRFYPKSTPERLLNVMCGNCDQHAYWEIYWKNYQVQSLAFFLKTSRLRELIKLGKWQLVQGISY